MHMCAVANLKKMHSHHTIKNKKKQITIFKSKVAQEDTSIEQNSVILHI